MSGTPRPEDFLLLSEPELLERLKDVSLTKIREKREEAAEALSPPSSTVLQMLQQQMQKRRLYVSTTLPELDRCLRGGLLCGTLTELVGPATVGKSQFCFSIALQEAAPVHFGGGGGKVIYFDTEGKFSVRRMEQIIDSKWGGSSTEVQSVKNSTLEEIWVVRAETTSQLMNHFQSLETTVAQNGATLVIIDSIAAILRAEFGHGEILQRQKIIGEQAAKLKHIAHRFDIPILVTNQVTTPLGTGHSTVMGDSSTVLYDGVIPALGTKWAHCVNTRVSLERMGHKRVATIRKSPQSPNERVYYKITELGVEADAGAGT